MSSSRPDILPKISLPQTKILKEKIKKDLKELSLLKKNEKTLKHFN